MADLGKVGEAFVELRARFDKLENELKGARGKIGKSGKAAGTAYAAGFRTSATAGFKAALVGLVSIAAIKQLGQAFVRAALPFNAALSETTTLIEGTVEQTEFLRDSARELASEFGGTGTEQVKGFYQAISAGAGTAEQAAVLLDTANKLAVGGATDLVTSIDALTSATNAYSKSGLTAADASDILFVGIQKGKTTAGELGASIGNVASIASDVGVSFDELVASIAALTSPGVKTSVAVNGLRGVLAAILKPSKEASELAKKLGIDFSVSGLKAKGFSGFLADLVEKTGGSSEAMAQFFGGVEALGPIISLTGATADKFAEALDAMRERAGATDVAYRKVADGLEHRFRLQLAKVGVQAEILGTKILGVLVPALETAAANITLVGDALIVVTATQIPRMLATLGALAAGLLSVGKGAGIAAAAFRLLGGPIGILIGVVAALATNFDTLRKALGLGETATNELKTATDKIVLGMADEIKQTQLLSGVLGQSTIISKAAAIQLLEQAKAHFEVAKAAVAQARAVALSSGKFAALGEEIANMEAAIASGSQQQFARDANEARKESLRQLIVLQQGLLDTNEELAANEKLSKENVDKLTAAIAAAKGELVALGGAVIDPITTTPFTPGAIGGDADTAAADAKDKRTEAILRLREAIQSEIETERDNINEIRMSVAALGEEENAREALIDQLKIQQFEEDLLREAKAAGLMLTTEETKALKAQIAELTKLTAARHVDQDALKSQEDAAASAAQAQQDMNAALKSTSEELLRAAFEGGNFIQILATLALRLLEIQTIQLTGGSSGGGTGILGTVIGAIIGGVGSIFGGGVGGAPTSSPLPVPRPGFADGGLPPLNQFSLVGEEGPELAYFGGSQARIFSNDDLKDALSGAGAERAVSNPVSVAMNITTPDVGSFRRSQSQVSAEVGRMIRLGQARQT